MAKEEKSKQEFHTKERKLRKDRAEFGRFEGAVKISWIIPSIKTEWTIQILLPV